MIPRLSITETQPTPLLRDFHTFLTWINETLVTLTPTNEFMRPETLSMLNKKMTNPVTDIPSSSKQPSYSTLHLFYHLALAGKLVQITPGNKNELILKPTNRLYLYETLKPAEKFFFLLETFWTDMDWSKLGFEPLQLGIAIIPFTLKTLSAKSSGEEYPLYEDDPDYFEDSESTSPFSILTGEFMRSLSLFGFFQLNSQNEEPKTDHYNQFGTNRSMTVTLFGRTLAYILYLTRQPALYNLPSRKADGELNPQAGTPLPHNNSNRLYQKELRLTQAYVKKIKLPAEPFSLPFVPFFAEGELQRTLPRVQSGFEDGTYTFRVFWRGGIWRRIEISANDTLLSLHKAILASFSLWDDRIYAFYMDGKRFSKEAFYPPKDQNTPHVDEAKIGNLNLRIGQKILYLYGYGHERHFQVKLETVRTCGSEPKNPAVVETKGKLPS